MTGRIAPRAVKLSIALGLVGLLSFAGLWLWSGSPESPAMQWRWRAKWLLDSGKYKAEVLDMPAKKDGSLRHVEWDGWGWAGMDTTVYLVYDPENDLAQAARADRPGKYPGIPCEVPSVRKLANKWYTVLFYTNTDWEHCP